MACRRCSSDHESRFSVEMNLHLRGLESLDQAGVWLFPEVLVCLDCGFAEFMFPESELVSLRERAA